MLRLIQSTNIDGAYLDYDKLTDEIFPVRNVSSSGYVRCGLGTDNVLWYLWHGGKCGNRYVDDRKFKHEIFN